MAGAGMKEKRLVEDRQNPEKQSQTGVNKTETAEELPGWPLVGLSIGSFIQVVAMDQQTCLLEVFQGADKQGQFCFIQGSLYDAVCGELAGEEAAMEIMGWQNVRLNIKHILSTKEIVRRIDKGLMSLLMESSRRQDETKKHGPGEEAEEPIDEEQEAGDERTGETPHGLKAGLERVLGTLRKNMGDALIGTAVIHSDTGTVVSGHQTSEALGDLFKTLTDRIRSISGEELGQYYYLDLAEDQTLFVLLFDEYCWGIVFHNDMVALGLFLNVIMPRLRESFEDVARLSEKK